MSRSPEQLQAGLARLDRLAVLTDAQFRVPVLGFRFGIEALIGLIPVIGDGIGALMSLYLFIEASRMGAPWRLRVRMLGNILLDFVIGLLPLVGDIGDIAFKANTRNVALLRRWADAQLSPVPERSGWGARLLTLLLVLVLAWACYWLVQQFVGTWM